MKKAKMILAAFAVVAIAGSLTAVKSKALSTSTFYTTSVQGNLGAALPKAIFTNAAGGTQVYYTLISTDPANDQAYVTTHAD